MIIMHCLQITQKLVNFEILPIFIHRTKYKQRKQK